MFTSGCFGGASERRRCLPECHSFVPVVRKQAETDPLHLTVPLQLMCLTRGFDLAFFLLTLSSVSVREARFKCLKKKMHAEPESLCL